MNYKTKFNIGDYLYCVIKGEVYPRAGKITKITIDDDGIKYWSNFPMLPDDEGLFTDKYMQGNIYNFVVYEQDLDIENGNPLVFSTKKICGEHYKNIINKDIEGLKSQLNRINEWIK